MGEGERPRGSEAGDQDATGEPTGHFLTIPEAAEALGISPEAVRSRSRRGTLDSVREGGRVYVILAGRDRQTTQERPASRPADRDVLVENLSAQVEYLRGQVEQERQAHAEARRIIAGLVERIPAIEAPPDATESPETVEQEPERGKPRSDASGPQEAVRRPWWRRVFGS